MTMFYVIGTYSDGSSYILGEYADIGAARGAIRWQGQPRGEIIWHDREKTRAETWYSGGRWPNEKTRWAICDPVQGSPGEFAPICGDDVITVSRGCYTESAFTDICNRAARVSR